VSLDIDRAEIDISCTRCHFKNAVTIRQVRLNDVVICRGCKTNLQLVDHMQSAAKARRRALRAFQELEQAFSRLGKTTVRI